MVVYSCNEILHSTQDRYLPIHKHMQEAHKSNIKKHKPETKGSILNDSTYIKFKNRQN